MEWRNWLIWPEECLELKDREVCNLLPVLCVNFCYNMEKDCAHGKGVRRKARGLRWKTGRKIPLARSPSTWLRVTEKVSGRSDWTIKKQGGCPAMRIDYMQQSIKEPWNLSGLLRFFCQYRFFYPNQTLLWHHLYASYTYDVLHHLSCLIYFCGRNCFYDPYRFVSQECGQHRKSAFYQCLNVCLRFLWEWKPREHQSQEIPFVIWSVVSSRWSVVTPEPIRAQNQINHESTKTRKHESSKAPQLNNPTGFNGARERRVISSFLVRPT